MKARRASVAARIGFTALIVFAVSAVSLGCGSSDPGSSERIDEARFLLDDSEKPPRPDDPRWQPVSLPDAWREQRPGVGGIGWYLLEVPRLPRASGGPFFSRR